MVCLLATQFQDYAILVHICGGYDISVQFLKHLNHVTQESVSTSIRICQIERSRDLETNVQTAVIREYSTKWHRRSRSQLEGTNKDKERNESIALIYEHCAPRDFWNIVAGCAVCRSSVLCSKCRNRFRINWHLIWYLVLLQKVVMNWQPLQFLPRWYNNWFQICFFSVGGMSSINYNFLFTSMFRGDILILTN